MSGRLRIGIVGLNFGRWIIDHQLLDGPGAPHFELAAVCDQDREKAAAAGSELGVPAFGTLEELLAREDVPVIGLFTGPVGRAGLVRDIVRAGRDVMTTKPFDLDPAAARAALDEAAALGRIVHLNAPAPVLPADLAAISAWAGDLGSPVAARAETWCSYREKADGSWYDDPALCPAAPLFRLGIYLVNDLVRLFGPAAEVHVLQSRLFTGRPTPDNAQLSLRFENGAVGSVFASFCIDDGQPYRNSLVLNYERGTVWRNVGAFRQGPKIGGCRLSLAARAPDGGFREEHRELPVISGDYAWDELADAVRRRVLPGPAFHDAVVGGVEVMDAMRRSAASGLPVSISR